MDDPSRRNEDAEIPLSGRFSAGARAGVLVETDHGCTREDGPMAELPPFPDTAEDADTRPDGDAPPGIPGWVKLFGIILLTLILLLVIIMVSGAGGRHGPGRHGPGRHTPAADVPALAAATEIVADEWLVSARPRLSEELVQR